VVAALVLGPVQGSVCAGQEIGQLTACGPFPGATKRGDPHGHSNLDRLSSWIITDADRRIGDVDANTLSDLSCVYRAGLGQQQRELFATETTGEIIVT
jgi:hypothetical protein